MNPAAGDPAHRSLPLARLLGHVADALQAVRAGESLTTALARCPAPARAGTQALAFGALRRLGTAQALRAELASRTPAPAVDALLLAALALLSADDAPYAEHTLVDQAVAAARERDRASAPFVNAVLRRYLRERAALHERLRGDPLARYNHPAWWIDRLRADWPSQWEAIVRAADAHPPMSLRVNPRRIGVAEYVRRLDEAGLVGRPVARLPGGSASCAVVLTEPCPVSALPGFADGLVSVQDLAAQIAAPLLADRLAPGARVLDACAAPGGKTAHLLETADVELTSIDRDAERLARVDQTLARLGLAARTLAADAAEPAGWWDGRLFDAILLDAPCSASGIVRRHPDIRWLRRASDIGRSAALQSRLLDALWPLLASGGRLLYCTCSVFKAEGMDAIDAFLQRQSDSRLADRPTSPGHLLPLADNRVAGEPAFDGFSFDGFYYALLQKS